MICKNCQHNNPEANRFCGMCGQPLARPQSSVSNPVTTAAPTATNARQTGMGLRDTPPVSTLPPLSPKPQSAAPVSPEKKVQFPPIAPPPQSSRMSGSGAGTPIAPVNGSSSIAAQNQPNSTASQTVSPQLPTGVVERRGPFPRTPLGPQSVASTSDSGAENKIQTPGRPAPQSTAPPLIERRAQNQSSYSQTSETRPLDASAFDGPATSNKTAPPERRMQTTSAPQRPAAAATPPAKTAHANTPIRVSGPSFLGLSDDPPEEAKREKEYDDLYKTHWGGRIAIVFVILGVAGGLIYLQWRSAHPLQAAASKLSGPQPPTAARVDNTSGDSAASATAAKSGGNPPAAAPTQPANPAAANNQTTASNSAGTAQLAANSNQPNADASTTPAPAKASAPATTNATTNAKPAQQASSIREGHEVAGKPQEDLEEPVRLAENYIQGRGVAQNCNAALGILRNASDRGNPRAEIKLGALYATGNCVAPDRVAAYRHFSRAMAAQPNNIYLEENRSRLWKDMSDAERKQAMEVEK